MGYKVVVAGATGNVGREMLNILEERMFPVDEIAALASRRSQGTEVSFGDKTIKVKDIEQFDFTGYNSGSAQPSLNRNFIHPVPVDIPPVPEQRAIAHILGTLDDKIELNRRSNETLEAMARTLFKAWFVDFEPVRAKMEGRWQRGQSLPGLPAHLYDTFPDRLIESELGEIPEGWEMRSLDSIANYLNGLALQKFPPESETEFLPVIKIAHESRRATAP